MIRLRTALPRDDEAVVDLIQDLNVFEAGLVGDRLESRAAALAYRDALMRRTAVQQGRVVLAVTEDGHPVGLMGFVVEEDQPFVRADVRRHGLVTDLIVREEWRGHGAGRLLLEEARKLTRAAGLKRLMIGVLDANGGARAAYAAFGFRDYLRTMVLDLEP